MTAENDSKRKTIFVKQSRKKTENLGSKTENRSGVADRPEKDRNIKKSKKPKGGDGKRPQHQASYNNKSRKRIGGGLPHIGA